MIHAQAAQEEKPFFSIQLVLVLLAAAAISGGVTYYLKQQPPAKTTNETKKNPNVIPLRPEPLKEWKKKSRLTTEQAYVAKHVFPYIAKHQKPIKDCYFGYKGKQKLPVKTGARVTVQFTVHNDGHISKPGIFRSQMKIKGVHDCILKSMKTWKFSSHRLDKPLTMQYPFFFR